MTTISLTPGGDMTFASNFIKTPQLASIYNASNQSIGTSANVQLSFGSANFDPSTLQFSNNSFKIQVAGYYMIVANVAWDTNTSGSRNAYIYKNGSTATVYGVAGCPSGGNGYVNQTATAFVHSIVGDTWQCNVFQSSGSSINVLSAGTSFNIYLVSK